MVNACFSVLIRRAILLCRGLRVPSYLGSSFAFIGPILAITGGNASRIPYALCGVAGAAVLYAVAAVATMRSTATCRLRNKAFERTHVESKIVGAER